MLKNIILNNFLDATFKLVSVKDIMRSLNMSGSFDKKELEKALFALEEEGQIIQDLSRRFALAQTLGAIKGKLKGNERGFAFLIPEDNTNDYFIPNNALAGAMHADTVFALKKDLSDGNSDEAYVIKIISRGLKSLVGTFVAESGFGFVMPDDKNYFKDIFVPFKKSLNAKTGDKVVVKIVKYPSDAKQKPEGEITEVLGRQFAKDAEEKSIIKTFNLPESFSVKIVKEAEKVASQELVIGTRVDLRNEVIVTIDGEDAKDLDDAISIKKIKDGYELGVHIADVSHYVTQNSQLDKEAYLRGTSVYFPDMVIPMLPEKISNGVCSLSEGEDKFALTIVLKVNFNGDVTDYKIFESLIKSHKKLTYDAVQKIIDGDVNAIKKYKSLVPNIIDMKSLADILTQKRNLRGSINLDMKEAHISVKKSGEIEISSLERNDARRIIEEFMILANETAAEFVFYQELPFIYRIHEKPSTEKLTNFSAFIKELGVKVKWKEDSLHSKDFQKILQEFEDSPLFALVNKVMLRSMSKAKYHPINIGHFGLSSACYCHFTAPIRRYPDLVVHRVIKSILKGQIDEKSKEIVYDAAKQSSERERNADEAERAMDDLYKVRYMADKIGQEFNAFISGVQSFGVFAELENTIEGLIKIDTLPRGRYDFDEKRFVLKSNKLSLKLGDAIRIKVVAANEISRKVEFILLEKITN